MNAIEKLTDWFFRWDGYLEKKSDADLESKTENAGNNNFTIFAKWFQEATGINVQGQPWCDTFIDCGFIKVFGKETAHKLLGGFSAYTPTSAENFQKINRWYTKDPKAGDIAFFQNSTRIYHTGFVYRVTSDRIYTIDGNTSSGASVIANGGGVHKKNFLLSNPAIAGYGRPDYTLVDDSEEYMDELNQLKKEFEEYKTAKDKIIDIMGQEIEALKNDVSALQLEQAPLYNYVDQNMPAWAHEAVLWMVDNRLLLGTGNGLDLTNTKLWVVVMLYRVCKWMAKLVGVKI